MATTVLYEDRVFETNDAHEQDDRLWLSPDDMLSATGWKLKPEGLCREEACVPLRDGEVDDQGRVDVTAFAAKFDRPLVHDHERGLWAFGEPSENVRQRMNSVQAPDFNLPDVDGNLHSLSEFRGRKVLMMTWGSYCGCRFDLPVWQVLYDELRDQDFEIVAVALDAGGKAAVEPSIRAEDVKERPDVLRTLMGWPEDAWAKAAPPSYTCLIDEDHVVSDLFGIKNVPEAVWVDEEGQIVRPSEPAGATDNFRQLDPDTFDLPEDEVQRLSANRQAYWNAIRDWVDKGSGSEFAYSPDEVLQRQRRPTEADARAALHARIGHLLLGRGDNAGSEEHFTEAVRLSPERWNYRRQSMVLEPELIGELNTQSGFFEACASLGSDGYYDTIDMPGIKQDPAVSGSAAGTPAAP